MTEHPGRREANKARTRAALEDAAYDILETEGAEALTVDRVADAAGISRRTFFNYYPSLEALIAAGTDEILDHVGCALQRRPDAEALPDCAWSVVEEIFTLELLREATRAWRAVDQAPAARRYALEAHSDHAVAVAETWARARLDPLNADPLRTSVLTSILLAAFDEARRHWLTTHPGDIDERGLDDFLVEVRRAIDLVRPAFDAD